MGSRRLPWVLVVILLMAVTALVAVLIMRDGDEADENDGSATPSAAASTTTSTTTSAPAESEAPATSEPAPEESGPPAEALPLRDPGDHLPADGVSAIPAVGEALGDEDYFAHLAGVDVAARTVDVDVEAFYYGDAAIDYLTEHDPTAEIPPPNDYVIVNDSTSIRTLPLAADLRIWDWCSGADGWLDFAERGLDEWAAAPAGGETSCDAGPALSHGWNEVYWLQVRDGEVKRVIGQYLP